MNTTLRFRLLGVAFAALLVGGVALTYGIYNKSFVESVDVTLKADTVGLQLPNQADVKLRGLIVGEVRDIRTSGDGAELDIALNPDDVDLIPANVQARILPKTLFGEKFVSLQIPSDASPASIKAGAVIPQAEVPIEVETVLADSYPLLTAVRPVDLSYTLNALSTGLEGRGEAIGQNLVKLNDYLIQLNPLVPSIVENLRLLDKVSDLYRDVLPDLARTLDNQVVTGNTIVDKQQELQALFDDVASLSSTTRDFLQANGDNIIRLGKVSLPTLQLLAKYSPEYPCLVQGMVNWTPHMASVYRDYIFHIRIETIPTQPTGYSPDDDPVYGAENGPHCETLPNPPYDQSNPGPQPAPLVVDDGVEDPHGKYRTPVTYDVTSGFAGTQREQQVINALAAPVMHTPVEDIPDIATLLLGPITRGTEVSLR